MHDNRGRLGDGGGGSGAVSGGRVGQVLVVAVLAVAALIVVQAFLFADVVDLSVLRHGVIMGLGVGFVALVMNGIPVPSGAFIAFGVLAAVLYAASALIAPPRGVEWLAFALAVAFPAGLIWWGVAARRARDGAGVK